MLYLILTKLILQHIKYLKKKHLNIFLPKQNNRGNQEYMDIKIGDYINIQVVNKKYEYLDKEILIIGKFISIE